MQAAALLRYVARHFIDADGFSRAAGFSHGVMDALISASALPGPIYRIWASGTVWSPIGGFSGRVAEGPPRSEWFSPAAVWWARRAMVFVDSGTKVAQVADGLREIFLADFRDALETLPVARLAYPDAFPDEQLDLRRATDIGLAEWADWIGGGYGVCLRRFDARSLAVKAGETARIRALTHEGTLAVVPPAEKLVLIDALERLDAVMLPFAPHQRPHGTPGKWVDAPLARYGMGVVADAEDISSGVR